MAGLMLAQGKKGGAAGDAAKGKDVFEQCSVCHNTDTDEVKIGPSLKGLFKHDKLKNGKPVNDANVRAMINAGRQRHARVRRPAVGGRKERRHRVSEDPLRRPARGRSVHARVTVVLVDSFRMVPIV